MATLKDLASQYGLEDYKQLLSGYPNATKFANALQSGIESHIPTTEDLQSPERMGEWSLSAALNQPAGLAIKGSGPSLSTDALSKYKDYVGEHTAPLGESGVPLHDLTANDNSVYPSDVYSPQANQYYGSGEPEDAQLFSMAKLLKDKPNEKVTIYRAVPKVQSNSEKIAQIEKDMAKYLKTGKMPSNSSFSNKSDWYDWASDERDRLASLPEETIEPLSINHGDWVALDRKYAKEHGESALRGNYKILSKKVPARQLFTNGDSIREWGWDSRYAKGGSVDIMSKLDALAGGGDYSADLEQLKRAYPNAEKFITGLKDAAYRSVPTTEQMRDPNFIIENAGIGGIIKPKGGNWLDVYGRTPEKSANQFGRHDDSSEIKDWLKQKLGKYIQNEMGTPEDPIRRIAEEWPAKRDVLISQQQSKIPNLQELVAKYEDMGLPPEVIANRMANAQRDIAGIQDKISEIEGYSPLHYTPREPRNDDIGSINAKRVYEGYPEEGIAKTDLGKLWEHYADENITPIKVRYVTGMNVEKNPWVKKLNDENKVYMAEKMVGTGFDKLADELRNAAHPDSNLPDFLRINPAKLSRVSVPQAVEHVAKINAWRDAERLKEGRNSATVMHKEYPDQGLTWMQMKMPENQDKEALKAALKFEGDTMGHCVGQYCDEVAGGDSNIYSLRDRRGEPHVTIETKGGGFDPNEFLSLNKDLLADPLWANRLNELKEYNNNPILYTNAFINQLEDEGIKYTKPTQLERIVQIKGKQNEPPVAKYLPAIQDFVRSKDWSMVHDLPNSGLKRLESIGKTLHPDLYKAATDKYGKFITDEELNALHNDFYERNKDIPIEGYAEGGLVGTPPTAYDPMKVADIVASIDAPHNY